MAFCPKCKSEYRAGITYCPDCKCDLVDTLDGEDEAPLLVLKSEAIMNRFTDYLSYSSIPAEVKTLSDGRFGLYASEKDKERVMRAFSVFVSVETGNAFEKNASTISETFDDNYIDLLPEDDGGIVLDPEVAAEIADSLDGVSDNESLRELYAEDSIADLTAPSIRTRGGTTAYVPASEKAADAKSTSRLFFFFGIAGILLIAVLRIFFGMNLINPFATIVFLFICIILLIVGFWSVSVYKEASALAEAEESLISKMNSALAESASLADVEAAIPDPESKSEEDSIVVALQREEWIVNLLLEKFPDTDESLLRDVASKHFQKLFPEEISEEYPEE